MLPDSWDRYFRNTMLTANQFTSVELNKIFKKPDTHDINMGGHMRLKYDMG